MIHFKGHKAMIFAKTDLLTQGEQMARRARSARGTHEVQGPAAPPSPYVQRQFPTFNPFDEESLAKLDAQIDWLIEDIGIAFRDDPEALRIWEAAGVKPSGETGDIIRADASFIRDLCKSAPKEFTQIARNRDRSVTIGGTNQVFAPIYGAPFVRDLEAGRRYGDMDAYHKLLKLAYMHPNLHHTGLVIREPCDVPISHRHLDMVLAQMTLNDKPHLGAITEMSRAQDSVDMAEILHGRRR